MKESLLQYLVCPGCTGSLDLKVETRDQQEIERGRLNCSQCSDDYPIIHGIPRFVPTDSYARSFSYQWTIHRTTQVDSLAGHCESRTAFFLKTGFTEAELKGKLLLDVGCGTGRYMEIAANFGAEVIGLDLSYAVDAAYTNMGRRDGVHVVQADLFKMPFRPVTFDGIYSIGVLHHTPSTRDAFLCLPRLLKPGGVIAIWVYTWAGDRSVYQDQIRSLTIRLPKRLLYGLCWIGVPLLHVMEHLPLLQRIARRVPTSEQHRGLRWDVLDTFDLYSPRYQWKHTDAEVCEWFRKADLEEVSVLGFPVSVRGRRPIGQVKAEAQVKGQVKEVCAA